MGEVNEPIAAYTDSEGARVGNAPDSGNAGDERPVQPTVPSDAPSAACICDPAGLPNVTDAQCPEHGVLAFLMSGAAAQPDDPPAAQGHIEDLMRGWRRHADLSRRRFMEVEREEALELLAALETVRGDVYLWRLGEIDAEKAMEGVRDAVGF